MARLKRTFHAVFLSITTSKSSPKMAGTSGAVVSVCSCSFER